MMDAKQKYQMTVLYGQGYSTKWLTEKFNSRNLQGIIDRAKKVIEQNDYLPANKGFYEARIRIAQNLIDQLKAAQS